MIALITGGSGCGKSTYAERIIASLPADGRVYAATMQVYDEESRLRVQRHREQRAGKGFRTVEIPKDLAALPAGPGDAVLVEDLVNLTANEMFDGGDWTRIPAALRALGARCRHLILVTNDVFSDGVEYPESTRQYLESLAEVNAFAARMADSVVEVVYSVPVAVKGGLPCAF